MQRMISVYNAEIEAGKPLAEATSDPKMIKWSSSLTSKYERKIKGAFDKSWICPSVYRPFTVQQFYGEPLFVHRYGKIRRIFPTNEAKNLIIHASGLGARSGFSVMLTDRVPDIQHIDNGQCFPLYLYEEAQPEE